jgi:membrane-bound lytic murein transglycosylase B
MVRDLLYEKAEEITMIKKNHTVLALCATSFLIITACAPATGVAKPTAPAEKRDTETTADKKASNFEQWLAALKKEALDRGIRREVLQEALEGVQPTPAVIKPRHRQAEFSLSKAEYVQRLASERRFRDGMKKMAQHRALLRKVSGVYGVPEGYLLALWAIESDFGQGGGRHPVIEALVTQAWQSQRQEFFRKQLLAALTILDKEEMRSDELRGSWAGAMGQFQFIPTTYLDYAVDFNHDGHRNIWTDVEDALASAASYLARAGWRKNLGWGWRTEIPGDFDLSLAGLDRKKRLRDWRRLGLPQESGAGNLKTSLILPDGPEGQAFLVTDNLRVLMRWNRSLAFALAVGHLADRFEDALRTAAAQNSVAE